MARYTNSIVLNKPEDFVNYIINDFMNKEGFKPTVCEGENVWKLGHGFLTSPQFIKTSYVNGTITLEAWLKFAWLPGVYSGEMGLDGFFGGLVKASLKEKVNNLISLLCQPLPDKSENIQQSNVSSPSEYTLNSFQENQPIRVKTHDTSSNAKFGLIFGLLSLIGWIVGIAGIIFGLLAIIYGKKGLDSSKRGMATAGMVIGIIMLVLSVCAFIINIINGIFQLLLQ